MSTFWLIAGLMLLAAVAAVLLPVWLYRPRAGLTQNEIDARVFRERLADLDAELAAGRLEQAQYSQLKLDLERTLLSDIPEQSADASGPKPGQRWLATALGLALPALALMHYYYTGLQGEPSAWIKVREQMNPLIQQAGANPAQLPPEALENLPDFARVLQAKVLQDGMNNPDELMLLGISFIELGAGMEAREAMLRALELAPDRIDVMLGAAQALLLTNEGRLDHTSAGLLHKILQQQPQHRGALMMLGFGAFNGGDYDMAQRAWQALLAQLDPNSQTAQLLQNSIAQAEHLGQQEQTAPTTPDQPSGTAAITVTVDVAPALLDRFQADDTLFIYAKAVNGPPMPLAAVRQNASGFPVQVVLDDSKAMLPEMKLSNFPQVVVGARISKAGDVRAKTGDLETLSEPIDLANSPLSVMLTVDQVVQ